MVATQKHSFTQAARFSGLHKSAFCKLLKDHFKVAAYTLDDLSKKQAKQFAKCLHHLKGLPWKIAILVDSTMQHRASLHPENTKKFNHGNGYVIGHQWTNIILVINDILIPLPPIPFYSQAYLTVAPKMHSSLASRINSASEGIRRPLEPLVAHLCSVVPHQFGSTSGAHDVFLCFQGLSGVDAVYRRDSWLLLRA